MELHERLVTTKPTAAAAPQKEPFADLKNSIHMLVISELGPQLTGQVIDPVGMRDRVIADIRRHLSGETGIARDDLRIPSDHLTAIVDLDQATRTGRVATGRQQHGKRSEPA